MSLERFFTVLARHGSAPLADWPEGEDLAGFGLALEGNRVVPEAGHDPLDAARIRAALSPAAGVWLQALEVHPVIGSTNLRLMERARTESVRGHVCMAELQLQGRGRRGRSWASPFGAQLALSLGLAVNVVPARLGGISLVVGLAVLDALEACGARGLSLKWPNDLLLGEGKLGGILIELAQAADRVLIVGIGLNVALPDHVRASLPVPVADVRAAGVRAPRSELAAGVLSRVVEFVADFERRGFEPFRAAFDARHQYHAQPCQVLVGDARVDGIVAGVSAGGGLLLETADGRREFHAGEVSLRQQS